jgi:hypothetical protein
VGHKVATKRYPASFMQKLVTGEEVLMAENQDDNREEKVVKKKAISTEFSFFPKPVRIL